MGEVDENLNYLLGRLSLVTQEFNQIKTGLGNALENIRSSFQLVQNKIQGKSRKKTLDVKFILRNNIEIFHLLFVIVLFLFS